MSTTLGPMMIEACTTLLLAPGLTPLQRREALRELLEWASETFYDEQRWQAAIERRRPVRLPPPSTT